MAPDERFAVLISEVAREVMRRQASEVCCGDLTLEQFQTMRSVDHSPRATIGSLSVEQKVDLSTMSRNVALLERNGYLLRTRSPDDARVVEVRLTASGRRALNTLRCSERDALRDIFDRISVGDRSRVLASLETLRSCLVPPNGEGAACCDDPVSRRTAS